MGYVAILRPNVYIGSKGYRTRVLQLSIITLIKADDKKDQRNDPQIIFIRFFSLSYYYYYSQTVNRNFAALCLICLMIRIAQLRNDLGTPRQTSLITPTLISRARHHAYPYLNKKGTLISKLNFAFASWLNFHA